MTQIELGKLQARILLFGYPIRVYVLPTKRRIIGGGVPIPDSPWNIAFWLRYVHNNAKRNHFRYRHGPVLDRPNSFETVEFS